VTLQCYLRGSRPKGLWLRGIAVRRAAGDVSDVVSMVQMGMVPSICRMLAVLKKGKNKVQ
jgi:hypothetical protein